MKKESYVIMGIGLVFIFAISIILGNQQEINAQECRIIRVYGGIEAADNKVRIEPETVSINKGSCVIWNNWAWSKELGEKVVLVKFSDGKKCEANTDAPTLYKMDDQNCYVSSYIAYGGTSSLRFTEQGTFEYVVESKDMERAKGKIMVK